MERKAMPWKWGVKAATTPAGVTGAAAGAIKAAEVVVAVGVAGGEPVGGTLGDVGAGGVEGVEGKGGEATAVEVGEVRPEPCHLQLALGSCEWCAIGCDNSIGTRDSYGMAKGVPLGGCVQFCGFSEFTNLEFDSSCAYRRRPLTREHAASGI